jgi:hypothetical protein
MTQPAPKPGKDKVADRALIEFVRVHQEQVAKDAAEHGGPLQTFNGRSALPHAIWLLAGALVRQTRKGWRRYHSLLRTDNGRDVVVEGNEVGR